MLWGVLGSVWMLQDVDHDVQERRPRLGGSGDDLGAGQEESVTPRVPQLQAEGIFHPVVVGPVDGGASCHVCRERNSRGSPFLRDLLGGGGRGTHRWCWRCCRRCI